MAGEAEASWVREAVAVEENVAPARYTLMVDGGLTRDLEVREGGTTTVAIC